MFVLFSMRRACVCVFISFHRRGFSLNKINVMPELGQQRCDIEIFPYQRTLSPRQSHS